MTAPTGPMARHTARLRWVLAFTRLGLASERLVRAFWPLWTLGFVVLASLLMGLQDMLQLEALWAAAVVSVLLGLWLLVRGLLRVRWPSRADALARLDETLPGRPVQALMDAPAMGAQDPATQALWQAHQTRMAQKAAEAVPPKPDWRIAALDPYGLRFVAAIFLSVALLFGSFGRLSSLSDITNSPIAPSIVGASWEGWVEPPSYTGLPTLYLNDQPEGALQVPVNSRVILRLYGEIGALTVQETVSARVGELPSSAGAAQDFQLRQNGTLEIAGPNGRAWQVDLVPDAVPEIRVTGVATVSGRGEMSLPFEARDDYDLLGGTAEVALNLDQLDRRYGLAADPEPRDPISLMLPLPVSGPRDVFEETLIEDFSDHVWAHLPVTLTLQIEDAAGQKSQPTEVTLDLPARRFFDPLANALIEQRRDLLWSRDNAPRVAQILRAVSHRPDDTQFRKETDYLRLRMILRRLETQTGLGLKPPQRDEIAQDLWDLAVAIEDGDLDDALARMQRAQERLSEAMKNGASDQEIAQLMQELREATQDYMRQLAQQQRENQDQNQQASRDQQEMMELSQDDLQSMMDRIQELMEQGRMAEAQQALQEFQEMMENMQVAQGGEGGESPGQQAMNELGETLREQQGLSDQAFRELQEQFNPNAQAGQSQDNEGRNGGEGRGQAHDGTGGQGNAEGEGGGESGEGLEGALADQQQALRQELNRQSQSLPGQGTPEGDAAREALGRAGEAMDQAEDALRQNELAEAIDRQAEAMNALREGMRNLGEALAQNEQDGGEGTQQGAITPSQDPLGRNPGTTGRVGSDEQLLQGEDVYRRARDLLDEIRKRSGETERPEQERNYLRRLLDRF
ncbi:TIGR02302 family protein [Cognatishimia sp.]|uniref:TIGR02302 family protein n=1 Tax=Cognatishimia sp. TaxID=2211648 RepID=UPI003517CD65